MVNALVDDDIAAEWGRTLSLNRSITALNLESNNIGSVGIEALAEAVRINTTLKELKLLNQRVAHSQAAEETLAIAIESNPTLVKVTVKTLLCHVHTCLQPCCPAAYIPACNPAALLPNTL